jgi:hypothetical protein
MDEREKSPEPQDAHDEAERRRRRALVFGEVLPETTRDERAEGARDDVPEGGTDEWLRRQVPPHHGGG